LPWPPRVAILYMYGQLVRRARKMGISEATLAAYSANLGRYPPQNGVISWLSKQLLTTSSLPLVSRRSRRLFAFVPSAGGHLDQPANRAANDGAISQPVPRRLLLCRHSVRGTFLSIAFPRVKPAPHAQALMVSGSMKKCSPVTPSFKNCTTSPMSSGISRVVIVDTALLLPGS